MEESLHQYRYFIKLSYDGSNYHGWQRQPNAVTIQETLEKAITMMLRTPADLTGAGRTDAGVHAAVYYAHFDVDHHLSDDTLAKLVFKLNSYLPANISIDRIFPVHPNLHARFSALSRTYKYFISGVKTPFRAPYIYYLYGELDVKLMHMGAQLLLETEDFTSFSKVDSDTKTNLCKVTSAEWKEMGEELVFSITANRFLRNMVRALVGTTLDLGKHRITIDDMRRIIEKKSRNEAGDSVPAKGLHLVEIDYPPGAFDSPLQIK